MGGNALKSNGVVRLLADDYKKVKEFTENALRLYGINHHIPLSFGDKDSFGDLDVLIMETGGIREFLRENNQWYSNHYLTNGSVDSVLCDLIPDNPFQVDFIYTQPEIFEFHSKYLNYNDLGNFYGRFAHKMGCKFGHDGLLFVDRVGTNVIGEFCLTRDFHKAITFLGFSPKVYDAGFGSLQEIFCHIANHDRFSPRMFDLAERNHTARVRDRKRASYNKLLAWIERNRRYLGDFNWNPDKSVYEADIASSFPDVWRQILENRKLYERTQLAKRVINGENIYQCFGLSGKDLGMLISHYKTRYPDWVERVLSQTEEESLSDVGVIFEEIFA